MMAATQTKIKESPKFPFLQGGGKMGEAIRSFDWGKTALGNPNQWHLSLQSVVGIILNSPSGKYIAWGEEYTQIYNDSYFEIIELHDPNALGKSAKETFTKSWTLIEPLFARVMQGEIVEYRDFEFPLERNGQTEICYFDFTYLPIYIENGKVGGVLATIIETTENKKAQSQLSKTNEQLSFIIDAAELATYDYDPIADRFTINDRLVSWFGLDGKKEISLDDALTSVSIDDRNKVMTAIERAMDFNSGGEYDIVYTIIHPVTNQQRVVRAKGKVRFNDQKIATRFSGTLQDITQNETTARKLASSERHLKSLIHQAPIAIATFRGKNLICEIANERALKIWGRTEEEMIGYSVTEIIPELIEQGIINRMQKVYETEEFFKAVEEPIYFLQDGEKKLFYFTLSFDPIYDVNDEVYGIMAIGVDVTEQVKIRREIEESNKLIHDIIENSPFPIAVYTGPNFKIKLLNEKGQTLWKKNADIIGRSLKEVLPESEFQKVSEQLRKVYENGEYYEEKNKLFTFDVGGEIERYYLNYQYTPLFDTKDEIYGILNTAVDVTDLNISKQQIEESEKRFRDLVQQAPLAIAVVRGKDYIYEMVNPTYLQMIHRTEEEVLHKKVFDVLPGLKKTSESIYQKVYATGKTQHIIANALKTKQNGIKKTTYYDVIYQPLKESCSTVTGLMVIATEVTETVNAQKALKQSEKYFKDLINISPMAIAVLRGEDFIIETANAKMLNHFWVRKERDVINKKLIDVFPELKHQRYLALFETVLKTGKNHNEIGAKTYVRQNGKLQKYYVDFELAPLLDSDKRVVGVIASLNDVTAEVESRQKLEAAEARLRIATEAAEIAIWELYIKENKITYSPRFNEIFGQPNDVKITRHTIRNQIIQHNNDLAILDEAMVRAAKTGDYHYQCSILKPDKSVAWISVMGKVFFDDEKKPEHIIGTVQDITKEKLQQKALENSEQKFRTLADSIPQIVWTADKDGKINYWNKTWFEYTGANTTENEWLEYIHADDREETKKIWAISVATAKEYEFEQRIKGRDDEYRWHLSRAIPQKDKEGNIVRWVGASTDIQEIKELEEQKDFFIGMASHELKTPITSINGYIQILQEMYADNGDRFLNSSLSTVDKQIRTLTELITDLLDLSKIKSGALVLNKTHFKVLDFAKEYISEIQRIHPLCNIIFEPSENIEIFADKERLGQVLINFLTNAVKYSPDECDVHVKIWHSKNEVTFSVQDFGIGISPQDQKRIFDRFYRVEGTNEKTYPGFGIGLNIAAEIIERHGGTVNVESEIGKGSIFSFTIPLTS